MVLQQVLKRELGCTADPVQRGSTCDPVSSDFLVTQGLYSASNIVFQL